MCHHYRAAATLPAHFVDEFSIRESQRRLFEDLAADLKDRGAWPLKTVPALRIDPSGELEVFAAEWGLLPGWWKPSDKTPKRSTFQRKTINARSETAASKPTFRDAWRRRRCLLPLEEFFERGHYFALDDTRPPMAFAGLWERWTGAADGDVHSVTLLTTEPNSDVRSVGHHRMPCLLTTPDERRRWLTEGADTTVDPLLRPIGDVRLAVRPSAGS
ncbi:SOS response-associated peptidase [Botrimarina sp.]|uniref:SOS response-associated peptidase n=1 Tax=Botrimarina sp. TaxID=2795802 RepID=UPI0032EC8245